MGLQTREGVRTHRPFGTTRMQPDRFGARAIQVYAPNGEHVADLGRRGDGPGEFQRLIAAWIAGADTVFAYDYRPPRVTWFSPDASLGGSRRIAVPRAPLFLGSFNNGDVGLGWLKDFQGRDPTRIVADTMEFGRFGSDGEQRAGLGLGPGIWNYQNSVHPVSPGQHAQVYRDSLYYTDGLETISVRDRDGHIGRRIPLPLPAPDPVTVWQALERVVSEREDERRTRDLRESVIPDAIPKISRMFIDEDGLIWVKKWEPESDAAVMTFFFSWPGGEWWVLDQVGRVVATVAVPEAFMPLRVRDGKMLGFFRDELNVERVRVYGIER
jgi:hypothetical protein